MVPPQTVNTVVIDLKENAALNNENNTNINSNTKNIVTKQKRKRINSKQLQELLYMFEHKTDTPSYEVREQLASKLNMTNREIQVWFQNRRAKMNKQYINNPNNNNFNNKEEKTKFLYYHTNNIITNNNNNCLVSKTNKNISESTYNEARFDKLRSQSFSLNRSFKKIPQPIKILNSNLNNNSNKPNKYKTIQSANIYNNYNNINSSSSSYNNTFVFSNHNKATNYNYAYNKPGLNSAFAINPNISCLNSTNNIMFNNKSQQQSPSTPNSGNLAFLLNDHLKINSKANNNNACCSLILQANKHANNYHNNTTPNYSSVFGNNINANNNDNINININTDKEKTTFPLDINNNNNASSNCGLLPSIKELGIQNYLNK